MRVFNYAKVSKPTLRKAIREAARIFRQAGVETLWRDHTPCLDGRKDPACHQPERPLFVNVHLLPPSMSQRLALRSTTFGLALPATGGGFGKITYLFCDRIEKECERKGSLPEYVMLGHVMAHEMGHLFLGHGSHSGKGIMRFPWHKRDLERASRGGLLFTRAQGKRIRAQVLERMRVEQDQPATQFESALSSVQADPEPAVKTGTQSPGRGPGIQVRIHDYAKVPDATLNRAEKEASRVLREAGIDTTFLHCAVSSEQPHEDAACGRELRPNDLVVSILSRSMARKVPLSGTTFGFARQSDRGGYAYVASVFFHRVEELAKHGVASRAVILGHVLAHEIGHLLLGGGITLERASCVAPGPTKSSRRPPKAICFLQGCSPSGSKARQTRASGPDSRLISLCSADLVPFQCPRPWTARGPQGPHSGVAHRRCKSVPHVCSLPSRDPWRSVAPRRPIGAWGGGQPSTRGRLSSRPTNHQKPASTRQASQHSQPQRINNIPLLQPEKLFFVV